MESYYIIKSRLHCLATSKFFQRILFACLAKKVFRAQGISYNFLILIILVSPINGRIYKAHGCFSLLVCFVIHPIRPQFVCFSSRNKI